MYNLSMSGSEDVDLSQSTACPEYGNIPGRRQWELLYPTLGDALFADISRCPPELVYMLLYLHVIHCSDFKLFSITLLVCLIVVE